VNRATEGGDIPGWPGRYTSGSRSDKRQDSRTSCKQRSLCQRFITSCAPAYAGAPGGSSLRATQCSTISTTSGILRQFQMPVPPLKTRALGDAPHVGAPLAAPSSGRASPAPTRRGIVIDRAPVHTTLYLGHRVLRVRLGITVASIGKGRADMQEHCWASQQWHPLL
jgi:hypothetical protein